MGAKIMSHYKAPDNSVHVVETEFAHLLPYGSVPITDEEAEAISIANAPKPTANQIRIDRDARISICDWTQLSDAPLTTAQKTAWKAYRQSLRDIPKQSGFPESVEWPIAPN
jgi:hypothetical protein